MKSLFWGVLLISHALFAQEIQVYSFGDQILATDNIELIKLENGTFRIKAGTELLNGSEIDSIKVEEQLFAFSTIKRSASGKLFYPLEKKYPHIWTYKTGIPASDLKTYQNKGITKGKVLGKPAGPIFPSSPYQIKQQYPLSEAAHKMYRNGAFLNGVGGTCQVIGWYFSIFPLIYVSPLNGDFQTREFLLFLSVPTVWILGGTLMKRVGRRQKNRAFYLLRD